MFNVLKYLMLVRRTIVLLLNSISGKQNTPVSSAFACKENVRVYLLPPPAGREEQLSSYMLLLGHRARQCVKYAVASSSKQFSS